ncbi:hypothetical protein HMN09_01204500 [Mycena chlorophos]|uniref:Uncharacterized protein n=1 Tax=Mycena chlorophos TaxID=658473 RepID=A0A8H6S712_MYCCL|nr:hypothetical protein HMN09_01204500 [Mycena chlorophos]
MNIVLTTPNGWEHAQQQRMRDAAITAGLVDAAGGSRIRFVTEAEAAVHCVSKQLNPSVRDWLKVDTNLIICDAGGGTVDITAYRVAATKPLRLEETVASQCHLAGAVYIKSAAEAYLRDHLGGTPWSSDDAISRILDTFDRVDKKKFSGQDDDVYITLSSESTLDIDEKNIARGRLQLTRATMASFFDHSLSKTKEGILSIFQNSGKQADKIVLVGGLSESPFFHSSLQQWSRENGLSLIRPMGSIAKVVPHGALHWHIDCIVRSRVVKAHFGTNVQVRFDANNPDHFERRHQQIHDIDGHSYLAGGWESIVRKGEKISSKKEFETLFKIHLAADCTKCEMEEPIYAYRGAQPPSFIQAPTADHDGVAFELVGKVKADLWECFAEAPARFVPQTGESIKTLKFTICLLMGSTELSARIKWVHDGVIVYGPASIAYL